MFWIGFASSFAGAIIGAFFGAYFKRIFGHQDLNSIEEPTTIRAGPLRLRKPEKRKPKVLTDLMAYQAEIQEEGENRG